jgi:hypothetical protein
MRYAFPASHRRRRGVKMPAVAVVVDVELEQRIAELVAARRPVLERLVAEAVGRELVTLVEAELDRAVERLASRNGASPAWTNVRVVDRVEDRPSISPSVAESILAWRSRLSRPATHLGRVAPARRHPCWSYCVPLTHSGRGRAGPCRGRRRAHRDRTVHGRGQFQVLAAQTLLAFGRSE